MFGALASTAVLLRQITCQVISLVPSPSFSPRRETRALRAGEEKEGPGTIDTIGHAQGIGNKMIVLEFVHSVSVSMVSH